MVLGFEIRGLEGEDAVQGGRGGRVCEERVGGENLVQTGGGEGVLG